MNKPTYVVGIGASAGGLKALTEVLKGAARRDDVSYVVVQHLPASGSSQLDRILARQINLAVEPVSDGDEPKGGVVHVMPAGYKLRMDSKRFRLDKRPADEVVNRAINYFFVSLAKSVGPHSFGVILSGTGTDGVEGVKAIEEAGGIVIVQDPATAQFDGMPENTIHRDHPDYVMPADRIASTIVRLVR